MDYPSNVKLLLLQILLRRQQTLAHQDKSISLPQLLKEPIVDRESLQEFQSHKLVRMYSPELCTIPLRTFKSIVNKLFEEGLSCKTDGLDEPITIIKLAEYYYSERIQEIQEVQLPGLKEQMLEQLQG
ncbi:SWR1-complex protein 7 [Zygosaccharomyces mellis]|uniref:SWR1-complex protein 7 n=1 Tax=Zygosaccharomyces mellis TaxID=42258 RepID=A0A4C2E3E1_9SACH|nr:SWR1-complex protein 7 [Zygosaccharomyces mellis]